MPHAPVQDRDERRGARSRGVRETDVLGTSEASGFQRVEVLGRLRLCWIRWPGIVSDYVGAATESRYSKKQYNALKYFKLWR